MDRFLASNLASVRNPSAFLVGVISRCRGEGAAPEAAAPAAAFAGFSKAAQLMGSTGVTSTGVPQNANPLLAPSRTIHVGNLSPGATPAVLRQIFECIGGVRDVRVAGDGRYGFVDFHDSGAAEAAVAMHGTLVCGAALRVEKAMQPRLFAQSNQPTPLPPAGARDPAAALLAFRATQVANAGDAGGAAGPGLGLGGVTSPAVLAALARQGGGGAAPAGPDPAFAFMNPAQQRAAREAQHRKRLAAAPSIGGWGVAKRRDETSSSDGGSSDSSDAPRGRKRRRRRRDRDRGRARRRSRSRSRSRRERRRGR